MILRWSRTATSAALCDPFLLQSPQWPDAQKPEPSKYKNRKDRTSTEQGDFDSAWPRSGAAERRTAVNDRLPPAEIPQTPLPIHLRPPGSQNIVQKSEEKS